MDRSALRRISAPNQATLVQNAIDSRPDGIAVTLAFPEAVGPVLANAAQAGIPTVVFNSGIDVYQQYGALMYFGSDESVAGERRYPHRPGRRR